MFPIKSMSILDKIVEQKKLEVARLPETTLHPDVDARSALAIFDAAEADTLAVTERERSEERRVGKECSELCRSRWSPYH